MISCRDFCEEYSKVNIACAKVSYDNQFLSSRSEKLHPKTQIYLERSHAQEL